MVKMNKKETWISPKKSFKATKKNPKKDYSSILTFTISTIMG